MLQLVDSSRDFEDEATVDRADAFKLAALGNLALCALGMGEAARAVEWCDKGLKLEPENTKVRGGSFGVELVWGAWVRGVRTELRFSSFAGRVYFSCSTFDSKTPRGYP